jgi:hypothetical protein
MEFTVKLIANLPSGTQIANQAFVQFDFLGPWGPAPKAGPWINTIDAGTPSSNVLPLPTTITQTDFLVEWTGNDDNGLGSGIASYDIFVSTDGGTYTLWLDDTTEISSTYSGQVGHSYAFYSIARDGVGHEELAPSAPDASTLVLQPNAAPAATADASTTAEDTPLTILAATLFANDTDADGDSLTLTGVGSPVNGTVALVEGNPIFTPASNFNGTASFEYTVSDGLGGADTAIVTITVTPVNDAPVAEGDTYSLDQYTTIGMWTGIR